MNYSTIQKYLPSKKVQVAISVLVIVGLVFLVITLVEKNKQKEENSNLISVNFVDEEASEEYSTLDSDDDGAYDWEEILWGLDPHDPMSNGSGVLDGIYIKEKQLDEVREVYGEEFDESSLTETEKLGRSLYTALLIANDDGNLDENMINSIIENTEQHLGSLRFSKKVYLLEDINVVQDTYENSLAYKNATSSLFRRYPVSDTDIITMMEASEKPEEYISSTVALHKKYDIYLEELLRMDVPSIIKNRHLVLINNIAQIRGALENLSSEEQDDIVTVSLFVQIENITSRIIESIIYINEYFELVEDSNLFVGVEEYEEEPEEEE